MGLGTGAVENLVMSDLFWQNWTTFVVGYVKFKSVVWGGVSRYYRALIIFGSP